MLHEAKAWIVESIYLLFLRAPLISDVPYRRLAILSTTAIGVNGCFCSALVGLELSNLWAVHVLHDLIRLPLLETETETLMRVILVVGLILVVFQLNEIGVYRRWVERQ